MQQLLIILLLASVSSAQPRGGENLLRIKVHGKIGFIDTTGKVVIEPRFVDVGPFSDGLAPAREPFGLFGYIDSTGRYALPPQFTYATFFDHGLAYAWIDSIPLLVDRKRRVTRTDTLVIDSIYRARNLAHPLFPVSEHSDSTTEHFTHIDSMYPIRRSPLEIGMGRAATPSYQHLTWHAGRCVVFTETGSIVIDSMGRHIPIGRLVPNFIADDPRYLYFSERTDSTTQRGEELLGVYEFGKGIIRKPFFLLSSEILPGRCYAVIVKGKPAYIHTDGSLFWTTPDDDQEDRNDFYDISAPSAANALMLKSEKDRIRIYWGHDELNFKTIPKSQRSEPTLVLRVTPTDTIRTLIERHYRDTTLFEPVSGMKIEFENRSNDSIEVPAENTSPLFILQALMPDGSWRDLEEDHRGDYLSSFTMPPRSTVLAIGKLYRGSYRCRLRYRITCSRPRPTAESYERIEAVSNEFDGSIHPGMLHSNREYRRAVLLFQE